MIAGIGQQVDRLMDDASSREQSFSNLLAFLKEKKSLLAATPSVWPVMGWVTSEFGWRTSPFGNEREFHKGIDIATRYGRPIQAPADGIVAEVSYQQDVGQMIRIDHGHGISHILWPPLQGDCPCRGDGQEGRPDRLRRKYGPQHRIPLHYAVMLNGVPVNPTEVSELMLSDRNFSARAEGLFRSHQE